MYYVQQQQNNGLGILPAVLIPLITTVVGAAGTITASAIQARTQKKANQAAKELAAMQNQQNASSAGYVMPQNLLQAQQEQQALQQQQQQQEQQKKLLLYAAIGFGAYMILKN